MKEFEFSFHQEYYKSPTLRDSSNRLVPGYFDVIPHGTAVAAMAVGDKLGVAKNAQFIGVKFRSNTMYANPDDLVDCWNWVVDHVNVRGRGGKAGKSLSYGKQSPFGFRGVNLLF